MKYLKEMVSLHGLRTPREEIAFTASPKIQSQYQIFRYGRSIFCLSHRPNFSDIFDLCLHWVSVVLDYYNANKKMTLIQQKTRLIDSIKGYRATQYITIDYDPQFAGINLQLSQSATTPRRLNLVCPDVCINNLFGFPSIGFLLNHSVCLIRFKFLVELNVNTNLVFQKECPATVLRLTKCVMSDLFTDSKAKSF